MNLLLGDSDRSNPLIQGCRHVFQLGFFFHRVCIQLVLTTMLFLGACDTRTPVRPGSPSPGAVTPSSDSKSTMGNEDARSDSTLETRIEFLDVGQVAKLTNIISTGFDRKLFGIVETLGGGVALSDFDCDGLADIFFAGGGTIQSDNTAMGLPGQLYRGMGGFQMVAVGDKSGFDLRRTYSHSVIVGDIDNDGFPDCLVTGYRGLQFFLNQGDGTFQEVANRIGLADDRWSTCGVLADVNNDGNLDVFVSRYSDIIMGEGPKCRLPDDELIAASCSPTYFPGQKDSMYLALGEGTFKDSTESAGIVDGGRGLGVIAADLDGDGAIDLYVANDQENNHLYRNNGHGEFTELGIRAGVALDSRGIPQGSMGVALGDPNTDGLLDLFVTNFTFELCALYRNRGKLMFRFDTLAAKIGILGPEQSSWGTALEDFDNDGDEDIVVISGHVESSRPGYLQAPSLLENLGSGIFQDVSAAVGDFFAELRPGRGLATGDIDGDGLVDFVSTNIDQPNAILKNQSNTANHYLAIRLIGTVSNRDAIGATVSLISGDKKWTRYRYGGGSFASTSDKTIHFGVPQGTALPAKLAIRWPSNFRTEHRIEKWDQRIDIVEHQ